MKKIIGIFIVTLLFATALPAAGTIVNDNLIIRETSDDYNNLMQQLISSNCNLGDWSEQDKLTASNGATGDMFGISISIDGDYAIVGADQNDDNGENSGSAYVFKRSGTSWVQEDKLTASDGATDDRFGNSVSIDGDYVIIGAKGDNSNKGSAYMFKRSGTSWVQEDKLTASDGAAGDSFGQSVSIDGDYTIVGAHNSGDVLQGSAYVFKRSGTSWVQEDKITAFGRVTSRRFGVSVSIDGDYVLVGANRDGSAKGSAYVFKRSGTSWVQEAKITASDGAVGDYFGNSVSIDGDYALVGAYCDDSAKGSAYVFKRSGTSWALENKLTASDGAVGDYFGNSVSIDGDYVIIGAKGDNSNKGSAYVFKRSGTSWAQEDKLTASDGATGDGFGVSVSIDGYIILIGAYADDSFKGSAYVFKKPVPDLDCLGSLSWTGISPGAVVTSSFMVANVGEADSELSWEIESYPTWGVWTFVPSSGTGLTPGMGAITINVEVVAPNEENTDFSGQIKIVNSDDSSNYDTIQIFLSTPKNKNPSCSLTVTPAAGPIPLGVNFTFSASDTDGYIASWVLDIDNNGTADYSGSGTPPSTQTHIYTSSETYTAKLTVTDDDGATNTATTSITTTEPTNQPPTANFTYNPDSPVNINDVINFTDSSTDTDGTIVNYSWDFDDGNTSYIQHSSHTYSQTRTYTVILTVTDNDNTSDIHIVTIQIIDEDENDGTPGFELLFMIGAIMAMLLIKRRKLTH